jgi:hypothetical protein
VEEIIGRLPELTEYQLGHLEEELRRERQRRVSSEGGGEDAAQIHEGTTPPSRRSWSTAPTRTAICSWSYAATFVVTAPPASADPTGTSSSTRTESVGSSISARPATQRAPWPPSGQSPWGGVGRSPGLALRERTRGVSSRRLGPRKDDGRDRGAKSSPTEAYRNRAGTKQNVADSKRCQRGQ